MDAYIFRWIERLGELRQSYADKMRAGRCPDLRVVVRAADADDRIDVERP
jgi:hypothetical protein